MTTMACKLSENRSLIKSNYNYLKTETAYVFIVIKEVFKSVSLIKTQSTIIFLPLKRSNSFLSICVHTTRSYTQTFIFTADFKDSDVH